MLQPVKTITENTFYPFLFQRIRLQEACWVNDQPCFTRRAIGEWLGYSDPQKAVDNIILKNPDINQFATKINLDVTQASGKTSVPLSLGGYAQAENGKEYSREYEQFVYNPIGFQLIVFESRQPKAKAYKIMVAKLAYAFMKGDLFPPHSREDLALRLDCERLLELKPYYERPDGVRRVTEEHGKHRATVYRWINRIEAGADPAAKPYGKHAKGKFGKHPYISPENVKMIERLAATIPDITVKQIIQILPGVDCSAKATVARIIRSARENER